MSEKNGPYEINEDASRGVRGPHYWVDGPDVHILVTGRGQAGQTRDALNIAYNFGRDARRPDSSQALEVAADDFRYIAEQCESVGRTEGVSAAEARTWKVVGRLAREAGKKIDAALAARGEGGQ